ncbi:TetR/AcrR family transcriptional regulator [Paractinoplanes maris]|uniref:TetR/AcrR family transcriptional regulator n=1 Tax=Paractinoplanes maris TaxID=1734446 RepID=UPI0020218443|nr:TetR/AcrR family transcriptional regulator [Actinoplanes maris]
MKSERRTQEQRSASTRAALITAARPLFAAAGFAGVSTEAIVRAAGVTRGAMYHQFADKTELFAAVFETVEAELTQRIDAAVAGSGESSPIALMKLGAATWLDAGAEPEIQRIVLIEAPSVLGWERWREISFRYGMGLVHSLVEHAIATGHLPAQPSQPLSYVLIGALDEASLYVARSDNPAQARREVGAVIDRLIAALAT